MKLPVFKKIRIGGISKVELIEQLNQSDIRLNEYAQMLFKSSHFVVPEVPESVSLVRVSLRDLSLFAPSSFDEIVDQAEKMSLKVCPLCLGAFLRLEYLDQREGSYLTVASGKLSGDSEVPNGLYLRNIEGSLWLRGYKASEDYKWPIGSEFVFAS